MLLAEQLVGEARERRARAMASRERTLTSIFAASFLAVAIAWALLVPDNRHPDLLVTLGLVGGYALILRVRFEYRGLYASPEALANVPLLLLGPLPYIPLLLAAAGALSMLPDTREGTWHRDKWLGNFADAWASIPALVALAVVVPGPATLDNAGLYVIVVAAHFGGDLGWTLTRNALFDRMPLREILRTYAGAARVDAILIPTGFVIALQAAREPLCLLAIPPLVWLMQVFSEDRAERYSKTLELQRAYRGTVMLLSEVVEYDDPYTAHHSRSIVELVDGVATELDLPEGEHQSLEFAALLHDVGKIAIPKEILNKPGPLNDEEFEVMKTHTIEGQFMLDRVGGRLGEVGEIVRSCHERYDGKGYPDGLAGNEIPLAARIIFVCDAFSAMTQDRVYRPRMSEGEALAEIAANAGGQFDPAVAAALIKVIQEREPEVAAVEQLRPVIQAASALHRQVGAGAA
jgi:HD domain